MATTEIWTFEDAVEHVLDIFDLDNSTRNKRLARKAVLQAYRDLPNKRTWSYYYRHRIIKTVASYSTGTVAFDYTGGAYERMVTLTTGTWPAWAARGKLIIGSVHYDVEDRKSDTVLTLTSNSNPGEDVAASTTYTLYRASYPLPSDFRKLSHIFDVDQAREVSAITADWQQVAENSYYQDPGTPWVAAIKNDGDYLGNMSVTFTPPPSTARTYDVMYEARPRELLTEQYSTGTVTVANSSTTTVTGTSTVWSSNHVGCILRFSSDGTNLPTSLVGVRASNLLNPFFAQRVVMAVNSTTSITMDASIPSALSGVKYTISDPIDLEANAMFTAFLRMAELEMALLTTRKDVPERTQYANMALRAAMEADERTTTSGGILAFTPYRHVNITG